MNENKIEIYCERIRQHKIAIEELEKTICEEIENRKNNVLELDSGKIVFDSNAKCIILYNCRNRQVFFPINKRKDFYYLLEMLEKAKEICKLREFNKDLKFVLDFHSGLTLFCNFEFIYIMSSVDFDNYVIEYFKPGITEYRNIKIGYAPDSIINKKDSLTKTISFLKKYTYEINE